MMTTRGRIAAAIGGVAVSGLSALVAFAGPAAASQSSATAQVTTNWVRFFKGSTPPAQKVKLLENGSRFTSIIEAQAKSLLAQSTTVKVLSVQVLSKSKATVKYTIYLGGRPALANQKGTAVLQSKVWKVGASSFCSLLSLEGTKTSACPGM
jgi:hypothetical protein